MEVIGAVASILQLIDATVVAAKYVHEVKGSTREREKLRDELNSLVTLLSEIKAKAEKAHRMNTSVPHTNALTRDGGPLTALEVSVGHLNKQLVAVSPQQPPAGSSRWKVAAMKRSLVWPMQKPKCLELLNDVERTKSLAILALQQDTISAAWDLKNEMKIIPKISEAVNQTQAGFHKLDKNLEDAQRHKIRAWLSPVNFFVVQKDLVSQYQQGSCSSFIDGNEIRNWIFGDQTRLWCTGIPGSGKTTAVAALVERLRATYQPGDKVKTAAVFCDFKMTEALSVSNIIAGIWLQITAFSGLGDDTIALYNANLETGTLPSLDDLLRLLQVELRSNLKLLLIIDALDELPDTSAMTLLNAINQLKGNLNVLITSRLAPVHQLPLGLTNAARLEISASSQDLERFIDTRINNQSLLLRHIQKKPELKGEIKDVIKRKCGKMFLMAKFHLDTICQQDTIRALRQQLESLPEDLDSFYEDQLSRILGSRNPLRDRAKHLLTWIHTATRHLTYLEMQLALSVNPNDSFLDTEALCDLETIVASCAGVVVIDAESQHIRFVHATFQEYITKANNRDLSFYSESQISTVCITYAMFTEFASGRCLSDEAMIARLDQYPLLIYVALNWHKHLRKTVDPGLDLVSKATLLLKHEGCRNTLAQAMFLPPGRFEGFSSTYPATPSALWMAAYCGLDGICLALLEENHFVDEEIQPDGSTALCAAATAGNISTVELLMDASANIQKQSNRSPLIEASKQSHVEIVHFLLTRGASPTQAGRDGRTALHAAVVGDFEAVVALLITQEPDISAYSQNTKWTPQHSAASVGAIKSLMLLLKSSMISLDPQTFDGETPLHLAVEHQRFETVQILLEAGADLLCQNRFGHIALHIAATKNAADICRLLLRRNQKITHSMLKMQDHSGQTVIHKAAERGAVAVIELLLSEEINYFTTDVAGYQPLHLAAENGHKDIVALLLSKGADYTSVTRRGLSCQQLAVARGHIDIVELLNKLTLKPTRHDSHLDSEMRQDQLSSPLDEGSNDKHQILSTKTQPNETGQQSTVPTVSAEASGERGQITLAKVLKTLRAPFESATTESTQTDLLSQPIAGRSKGFLKRLRLEITDVERSGNKFSLSPLTDDLLDWEAKLPGPANSDYAGGFFRVEINFTDNYPFTPPNIFFVTKIFHTNVHDSGHISLNLFASNPSMSKLKKPRQISSSSFGGATQWSPALTILKCLISIDDLLTDPWADGSSTYPSARLYIKDRAKYHETARVWTKQYAV